MKIRITNVCDNIKIPYSLLLLRGKIVNSGSTCENVVTIRKKNAPGKLSQWPVIKRQFIAYVDLDIGCNILIINYNCSQLQLRMNYVPQTSLKFVRPIYIVCKGDDGNFQAPAQVDNSMQSACDRIKLGAQMLQMFVAESLNSHGLGRKTFKLAVDDAGKPSCWIFRSSLTREEAQKMQSENQLWKHFGSELMTSQFSGKLDSKFLAFMSFTEYKNTTNSPPNDHDDVLKMTKGHAALGGGGLALFGTGCLHTWPRTIEEIIPCFTDMRQIDKMQFMDDSAHRGSYWACFSTGLGAALHELGHTFNLAHNQYGIMSRGFDDMNKFFVLHHFSNDKQLIHNSQLIHENLQSHKDQDSASKFTDSWLESNNNEFSYGGANWYRSSALLLAYHKWFNNFPESDDFNGPTLNELTVSSKNGIRLIEVRDKSENTILHFWEFLSDCKPVNEFVVNVQEFTCAGNKSDSFVIVAEDSKGNILKSNLNM